MYNIESFDPAHLTLEPNQLRPYFFRFFLIRQDDFRSEFAGDMG